MSTIQYFLLQTMTDIQENILFYSETVINTVCRSIQVSEQKICGHVTFLQNKNGVLIWDSRYFMM